MNLSAIFTKLKEIWFHSKFVVVGALVLILGVGVLLGLKVLWEGSILANQLVGGDLGLDSVNLGQTRIEVKKKLVVESAGLPVPEVVARAVLVEDLSTGTVLYEDSAHEMLSPASTTKMMTALVGVEYFKDEDMLEVRDEAMVSGSSMGLKRGEVISFRSLLYGMLLNSGNDASYAIASNYPGGVEGFVGRMNQKVLELRLTNTHFSNPAGFDIEEQYSSAFDLGVIAKALEKEPRVAGVVATKQTTVVGDSGAGHVLNNLNQLLGEEGVIGIKTGTTQKSGENLVALVDKGGKRVLIVILGSENRFKQARALIDWIYSNFTWVWR